MIDWMGNSMANKTAYIKDYTYIIHIYLIIYIHRLLSTLPSLNLRGKQTPFRFRLHGKWSLRYFSIPDNFSLSNQRNECQVCLNVLGYQCHPCYLIPKHAAGNKRSMCLIILAALILFS